MPETHYSSYMNGEVPLAAAYSVETVRYTNPRGPKARRSGRARQASPRLVQAVFMLLFLGTMIGGAVGLTHLLGLDGLAEVHGVRVQTASHDASFVDRG